MNQDQLKKELMRYEGYSSKVYLDSLGLPTVGIGHMDRIMVPGTVYSPNQIDILFNHDIANAIKIVDNLNLNLDEVRYRVLVQLCFNLGNKINQFVHFLSACKSQDWDTAASELKNSSWYTQVGHRGPETCYAILNGCYQWE